MYLLYWLISIVNLRSPSFDLVSWLIEDKEELEVRLLFGSKFVKVLVPSPKLLVFHGFHDFTWSIVWRPVLQKSIASAMVQCAKPCRNLCAKLLRRKRRSASCRTWTASTPSAPSPSPASLLSSASCWRSDLAVSEFILLEQFGRCLTPWAMTGRDGWWDGYMDK